MPKIFISYSRKDEAFARLIATDLSDLGVDLWLDVDDIPAGMNWSSAIQQGLDQCELMIVILSPDSVRSPNVENEWQDFLDKKKPIVPVLYRPVPSNDIHFQVRRIQYIDFHNKPYEASFKQLYRQLHNKGVVLPPSPTVSAPAAPPVAAIPLVIDGMRLWRLLLLIVAVLLIIGILALISTLQNPPTTSATPTTQAALAPTDAQPPTEPPTLDIVFIVATLDAQGTAGVRATNIVSTTQAVIDATATATLWTNTPTPTATFTPNITASIDAFQTQRAATSTAQSALDQAATTTALIQLAENGVQRNADWQPYSQTFNGVEMMLVPKGCFNMGSNNGTEDEKPVTQICFDAPFWIDRTEVTNQQYGSKGQFSGDNQPRETLTWNEALEFCEGRGARLPTEAEWEYAARGPDGLAYPWGNGFVPENAVYRENARQAAEVGSRPAGTSWVGALDMSGNLAEWVSSAYLPYPYVADDGRENLSGIDISRVLRGGSSGNNATVLRLSNRIGFRPTVLSFEIGFRCAKDY